VSAHILRARVSARISAPHVGADLRVRPFPHDHPDNSWAHTQVCPYNTTGFPIPT